MAKTSSTSAIRGLMRMLTYMMTHDKEMPISRLQMLLIISTKGKEGCLVRDLVKATGMNQSTVARSLSHLSSKPLRGQKTPLHLISVLPDADDPRRVRAYLTEKGEQALAQIETMLN